MSNVTRLLWDPGNSTRYELLVTEVPTTIFGTSGGYVVVGPFPDHLRAMVVPADGFLDWTYVADKLDLNETDATMVAIMLGKALGIEVGPSDDRGILGRIRREYVAPVTTA